MIKKILKFTSVFLAILILVPNMANAIETEVIDEKWGKPIFVFGSGLNDDEIKRTGELLGIKNYDNVNMKKVDGNDEIKYLGSGTGDSSSMISSVLVKKTGEGSGIKIRINTPENITQITSDQYRNASITAGVNNCDIVIASVKPVTGESALTGIYKAYDANGETLNLERMVIAQKELETTNEIAQENKDKKNFSIDQLNQVIINIKQEINNYYEQNGESADAKEIEQFIRESIEKYDLESVITSEQVSKLNSLFNEYKETGAVNSDEVKEQLRQLADEVSDKAAKIYQDAKDSGILDKIANFFKDIIKAIFKK
ncbi:MAG: DUF1002 domain-containing protein [Tissierellia bacterium]|nr:DUF1002 domain-containing protein [Tissierellia bacterium]